MIVQATNNAYVTAILIRLELLIDMRIPAPHSALAARRRMLLRKIMVKIVIMISRA
jgi:hypothetical protein